MSYNISTLFGNYYAGSNNSASSGVYSALADYKSLRTGATKKLLNAYYNNTDSSSKDASVKKAISSTSKNIANSNKALTVTKSDADALTKAASKLADTSKDKNLFADKSNVTDDIYSAVKSFVKDYNSVIDDSDNVDSTSVLSRISSIASKTSAYSNKLEDIGITVESDGNLKIDEDTLKKADVSKVKDLFNGAGSFAGQVMTAASGVASAATVASSSSLYGASGAYLNNYSSSSYNWFL